MAVSSTVTRTQGVSLHIWQDDTAPVISGGNKRFKLDAAFKEAQAQGAASVLTFGGAWSNHIHATAFQARQRGLGSIGIIRGDRTHADTATLADARRYGMELQFVSREQYRNRHNVRYLQQLQQDYPDSLIVPEGGSSPSAAAACGAILDELNPDFVSGVHTVTCAVGTGATLCGVHQRLRPDQHARGYAVVKDPSRAAAMQQWLKGATLAMPEIVPVFKPRYGQLDSGLLQFIDDFYQASNILLDPLYTSKMMQRLQHEIAQGLFPAGARVLALHTGGLQGWRGFLTQAKQSLTEPTLSAIETLRGC